MGSTIWFSSGMVILIMITLMMLFESTKAGNDVMKPFKPTNIGKKFRQKEYKGLFFSPSLYYPSASSPSASSSASHPHNQYYPSSQSSLSYAAPASQLSSFANPVADQSVSHGFVDWSSDDMMQRPIDETPRKVWILIMFAYRHILSRNYFSHPVCSFSG